MNLLPHSPASLHSPRRPARARRVIGRLHRSAVVPGVLAALVVGSLGAQAPVASLADGGAGSDGAGDLVAVAARADAGTQPRGTATFQIASFNLLGAGHTDGKNPRKGFAKSGKRMDISEQIIESRGIDVIGFQEMHYPQAAKWVRDKPAWGTFPGTSRGADPARNSISWRMSEFDVVKRRSMKIPYFNGDPLAVPYVQLQQKSTGQRAWFLNVHNPADVGGNQKKWRTEALRREAELVTRLKQESPEIPVFMTGDMNDRTEFYCPMTKMSPLISSSGGHRSGDTCTPPDRMDVDWIMGTAPNQFTSHSSFRDARVKQASDHPFVSANANILAPAFLSSKVDHVVVLAAGGLGSALLRNAPAGSTRSLKRLINTGAATYNARTAPETSRSLPNLVTLLTGRRVARSAGGHGITKNTDTGGTISGAAGTYVSSVFDLAHNNGLKTAFYGDRPGSAIVSRTWDEAHGGGDPFGIDNGRNKIDVVASDSDDTALASTVARGLRTAPANLTVVELTDLAGAEAASRYRSTRHLDALRRLDRQVGTIVTAINANPELARSTMVVVTGIAGAASAQRASRGARVTRNQVPLIVRGPGLGTNADLYALNPGAKTGSGAGRYDGSGPILVGNVPNFALAMLGLPAIPGSQVNTGQRFTAFPRS